MAGPCGPAKMVLVLSSFFKNIEKMAAYGCHFFKILAKNHRKKKATKGKIFPTKGKNFPTSGFFFPGLFLHSTLEKCEYIKKSNLFFFFSRFFSISGFDQRFVSFRWLFSMVSKQKRPLVSLVAFSLFDHGK